MKTLDEELLSTERWEEKNSDVDKVKTIDRELARIVIKSTPHKFSTQCVIWNTRKSGFTVRKSFDRMHMSKNNKFCWINTSKSYITLRDNKWWWTENKKILPLTYQLLRFFLPFDTAIPEMVDVKKRLFDSFSPTRFIEEGREQFPLIEIVSFNNIIKHKLYSLKKLVTFAYKCCYPEAINRALLYRHGQQLVKQSSSCVNFQGLNKELIGDKSTDASVLVDTIRFAEILNEKVNLGWSIKRLIAEHNRMSQLIDNISGEFFDYELKIHKDFLELEQEEPDLKLYRSSRELIETGRREQHCVGSYGHHVDTGTCAIFDYKGFTAQIMNKPFRIGQIRGPRNSDPGEEIKSDLANILLKHWNSSPAEKVPQAIAVEQFYGFEPF